MSMRQAEKGSELAEVAQDDLQSRIFFEQPVSTMRMPCVAVSTV